MMTIISFQNYIVLLMNRQVRLVNILMHCHIKFAQILNTRNCFFMGVISFQKFINIIIIQVILIENHMRKVHIGYYLIYVLGKVKVKSFKVFIVNYMF